MGEAVENIVTRGKYRQRRPRRDEASLTGLRDKIGAVNAVILKHVENSGYLSGPTPF